MRMLATQLIIQAVAVYLAYNYGVLFTVITTYPDVWTNMYHESIDISGLNFISMAIGETIGTQLGLPINDHIYQLLKKRKNGDIQPEFRVPLWF